MVCPHISVVRGEEDFLAELRADLKARRFAPLAGCVGVSGQARARPSEGVSQGRRPHH